MTQNALVAIAFLIVLMRILRVQREKRNAGNVIAMPGPVEERKAA